MSMYKCSMFLGGVTGRCKLSIHVLYKTHIKVIRYTNHCQKLFINGPQKLCKSLSSNMKFPCCHCNLFVIITNCNLLNSLTLYILRVTNINFLLQILIYTQGKRLRELLKWSLKKTCFDLLTNSLNLFYGKEKKCWVLRRRENWSTGRKISRSNQVICDIIAGAWG